MKKIIGNFKYFESQEENEKVLILLRKHNIYLLTPFFIGFVLLAITIIMYWLLTSVDQIGNISQKGLPQLLLTLIILFIITYIYTSWFVRYCNIVILTDEHLVEIEQLALFSRRVSVLDLDQIEDVTFSQHGFIQTFFDFGDLEIQTAGATKNFTFKNMSDPDHLQRKIMELKELEEGEGKPK